MKYISIKDLNKYLDNKTVLIDVRENGEYKINHLTGAINMPVNNILTMVKIYPKNTRLILYCNHGRQSLLASNLLNSVGYTNLYVLKK